jgi:prevent-host-death family protein
MLPLSQFRANASAMLDLVAQGKTVRIMRHGKPVADLVPVREGGAVREPSWKRPFAPLRLPPGRTLSQAVLDERSESARRTGLMLHAASPSQRQLPCRVSGVLSA